MRTIAWHDAKLDPPKLSIHYTAVMDGVLMHCSKPVLAICCDNAGIRKYGIFVYTVTRKWIPVDPRGISYGSMTARNIELWTPLPKMPEKKGGSR